MDSAGARTANRPDQNEAVSKATEARLSEGREIGFGSGSPGSLERRQHAPPWGQATELEQPGEDSRAEGAGEVGSAVEGASVAPGEQHPSHPEVVTPAQQLRATPDEEQPRPPADLAQAPPGIPNEAPMIARKANQIGRLG